MTFSGEGARGENMLNLGKAYEAVLRRSDCRTLRAREQRRSQALFLVAEALLQSAGLRSEVLEASRLAGERGTRVFPEVEESLGPVVERERAVWASWAPLPRAHFLGQLLDAWQAIEAEVDRGKRLSEKKKWGSYFTPPDLARQVVRSSWAVLQERVIWEPRICDPAMGGGAFLLEAAAAWRATTGERGVAPEETEARLWGLLHGVDRSSLAVAVAEVALYLFFEGRQPFQHPHLKQGDALLGAPPSWGCQSMGQEESVVLPSGYRGFCFNKQFPHIQTGFDWVVGNPPWVAFQGRAARPLDPALRDYYRRRYVAFRGYPTLQSLFVQRAAEIAPQGVLSLLVPSSLSDLAGYEQMRGQLEQSHAPCEPLEEYGEDAFSGVVQPCFALIAVPRSAPTGSVARTWTLQERSCRRGPAQATEVPPCLLTLAEQPAFPPETFGELGFQTNRQVSEKLLLRAEAACEPFAIPLLEGRNVQEFLISSPRLFLHRDLQLLAAAKCHLRPLSLYQNVAFVVRQTAAFPIAARGVQERFRNSLLAGYETEDWDGALLVALLNSPLYRALHVAQRRDARQATFPQMKVSHLRRLPRPPRDPERFAQLRRLTQLAEERRGLDLTLRQTLHSLVCELFALGESEQGAIWRFLEERAPSALRPVNGRGKSAARVAARQSG